MRKAVKPFGGRFFVSITEVGDILGAGKKGKEMSFILNDGSSDPVFCRGVVEISSFDCWESIMTNVRGNIKIRDEIRPFVGQAVPSAIEGGQMENKFRFLDVGKIHITFVGRVKVLDDGSWKLLRV